MKEVELEIKTIPFKLTPEILGEYNDLISAKTISRLMEQMRIQIENEMGIPKIIYPDIKLALPVYFGKVHSSIHTMFHDPKSRDRTFDQHSANHTMIECAVGHFFDRVKGLSFTFIVERDRPDRFSSMPYSNPYSPPIQEKDELAFCFSIYDYLITFPTKSSPLDIRFKISINNNPLDCKAIDEVERLSIATNYYMVLSGAMEIDDMNSLIHSINIDRLLMFSSRATSSKQRIVINSKEALEAELIRVQLEEQLSRRDVI